LTVVCKTNDSCPASYARTGAGKTGVRIDKGRYRARLAASVGDLIAARSLRHRCFASARRLDLERIDNICDHVLIETLDGEDLVACFRMLKLEGANLHYCYSGQYYDLDALRTFEGPMLEVGRFCIDPLHNDPDILRLAWSALTTYVDRSGVRMLFGCSSFQGIDPANYPAAFALLRDHYLAPRRWAPRTKANEVFAYAADSAPAPEMSAALRQVPPLLRSYLSMGARVSDHAVIDRTMNTLHVFTGLEVDAIPDCRKRLLRAISTPEPKKPH
jgi:putative hemolysin